MCERGKNYIELRRRGISYIQQKEGRIIGLVTYSVWTSSFTGFYNPLAGFSLLILEVSRLHTMTHHSR
jgi:hypothetical protein